MFCPIRKCFFIAGDSGGGIFIKHKRRWYLRGITSVSFMDHNGECDVRNDAVFTNVLKFSKWINDKISDRVESPQKILDKKRPKKEVFCYIYGGATVKPGGLKSIEDINLNFCTILVYIFVGIDGDNLKPLTPEKELLENDENSFRKFTSLKKKYPHLLTLLAVGGWDVGSVRFSQLAADPERRKAFSENAADFLKKYDFDGLNIYWEYPTERGGVKADKNNLVELLSELSDVFQFEDFYLTISVRTLSWLLPIAYDIKNIAKYVDYINMMTFGYAGYWDKKIGFTAPLNGEHANNLVNDVAEFIKLGAPPEKLVLGVAFHGRSFITNNTGNIGDASFGYKDGGSFFWAHEFFNYNKVCEMRKYKNWEEQYDENAAQIIGKFINKEGRTHVFVFDSPRSIAVKVKFAMEKNLGGVWTGWSVAMDDHGGECEPDLATFIDFPHLTAPTRTARDFPLLRTINETLELTKYLWKC